MQFRGRRETLAKLTGYAEAATTVREVIRDSAPGQSPVASGSRPRSLEGVIRDNGAADAGLQGGMTRVVAAGAVEIKLGRQPSSPQG
jgi:hypothetical protein